MKKEAAKPTPQRKKDEKGTQDGRGQQTIRAVTWKCKFSYIFHTLCPA